VNFLAHLVLAPQTPEGWVGSIAPDMIRGPLPADLDPRVAEAAREHQQIDRQTDSHPAFHRTRDWLRGYVNPRLAGILADVLYDHVLACNWSDWRSDTLGDFVADAQRGLVERKHLMPVGMQTVVQMMLDEQWLTSYASPVGLRKRLTSMSGRLTRRLRRPMDLTLTGQDLPEVCRPIADDFAVLWPDLKAFVADHRSMNKTRLAS